MCNESNFQFAEQLCVYGFILFEEGQLSRARESFDRALTFDGLHAESLLGRGLLLMETGEAEEAASSFIDFICLEPEQLRGYLYLATAQWQAGWTDTGFKTFGRIISSVRSI